jgi:hypothetical protein
MRRSLGGSLFVVLVSFLLGSCGGGGASSPGPQGGPLRLLPQTATFYAGVEYTLTLAGGRAPYFLTSSEPSLLPVPSRVNGNFFSVIPANPGVVDASLPVGALPVRTVSIQARDSAGVELALAEIQVAQNFLTGYNVLYTSNCSGTAPAPSFCTNGETVVEMTAAINGNLYGNREYRFEIVRGPIFFKNIPGGGPVPGSGTLGPGGTTWTTRTDHEGDAHAIIGVSPQVPTQIGIYRIVDVATGASTQYVIVINGVPQAGAMVAIPDEFTLAGVDTAHCGTGAGDFFVFDGIPPYRAVTTFPQALTVEPVVSNEQPGRFRFSAGNPFFCMDPGSIIITDANNQRVTVEVTTEPGEGDPPPLPMQFTPGSLTLACGASGSVIVTGGAGTSFTVAPTDARITATVASRVITLTRTASDPVGTPVSPTPGTPNPISFSVNVTDGTNVSSIGVTAPSNCPP